MNKLNIFFKDLEEKLKSILPKVFDRPYFHDRTNQIVLGISALVFLIVWIASVVLFQPNDFLVPIRYNSFLGVTELGNWYHLYQIPLIMTLCSLLNLALSITTYKKDKMIAYIFASSNIFITLLALIVAINFSILGR